MITIGLIGCGHWGPNHIRHFMRPPKASVKWCADLNVERLEALQALYPGIRVTQDYRELLEDEGVDAVVVATPTITHFEIVRESLLAGKDVLCEKPLTTKQEACEELITIAERGQRILMIGHVFLFNAGIQMLREYRRYNIYGEIRYLYARRTNLGPFRSDVNVVWDLASHDVSIFSYLFDEEPVEVSAKGASFLQPGIEDVGFISLTYRSGVMAHLHVSWLDPKKVREITVVGERKMVIWNDMDREAPIRIYDRGVTIEPFYADFGEFQLLPRRGDISIPAVHLVEPLKTQDEHFLEAVRQRKAPRSDGHFARKVVKVLEAVERSMKGGGTPQSCQ
ncbi:MAG: gfo/Idh/MocA family oxidoreductase [Deltaproteobacteria bacterium]|nr:MAG: gfo/Idh/MocA family oxidoreductase [Deltaproteobacteria bacterium]